MVEGQTFGRSAKFAAGKPKALSPSPEPLAPTANGTCGHDLGAHRMHHPLLWNPHPH